MWHTSGLQAHHVTSFESAQNTTQGKTQKTSKKEAKKTSFTKTEKLVLSSPIDTDIPLREDSDGYYT